MKAISHQNRIIQMMNSPDSKQEAILNTNLYTSCEGKENLCFLASEKKPLI